MDDRPDDARHRSGFALGAGSAGRQLGGDPDGRLHALHAADLHRGAFHVGGQPQRTLRPGRDCLRRAQPLHDHRSRRLRREPSNDRHGQSRVALHRRAGRGSLPVDDSAVGSAPRRLAPWAGPCRRNRLEGLEHRVPARRARRRRAAGKRPDLARAGLQRQRRRPDVLLHRQPYRRTAHRTVLGLDCRRHFPGARHRLRQPRCPSASPQLRPRHASRPRDQRRRRLRPRSLGRTHRAAAFPVRTFQRRQLPCDQ